ncbi:hypothetical protein LMG33818_000041 [Halomonadaceae bacterium LMG 33818]|uniref:DUF2213 domain-containing protein n=1 Tax=Cernens ardua TaxID=3402176 RepID=UPI003EDC3CDD
MANKKPALKRGVVTRKKMAQDFAQIVEGSKRSKNEDGYLQVKDCPVMTAGVSPYYGYEIADDNPDIDPEEIYYAFRPADEIEEAMETANGVPLLRKHKPDSAAEPNLELRVGSVGTSPTWDGETLKNTLTVTDQDAIDAIEDRSLRELSPGYYYDVDWKPGEYKGIPYDFIMKNIRFNHLALVAEARQGPSMYVADSKPTGIPSKAKKVKHMNRKQFAAKVALRAAIRPYLATDAMPDIDDQVESKNGPKALANAVMKVIKPELSEDCDLEADDLADVIKAAQQAATEDVEESDDEIAEDDFDTAAPADSVRKVLEQSGAPDDLIETIVAFIQGAHDDENLDDDDQAQDEEETESRRSEAARLSEDEDDDESEEERSRAAKKSAMDAATVNRRIEKMRQQERDRSRALHEAGEDVRSVLGSQNVFAFDSASDIYKKACKKMGLDTQGVHPSAMRSLFRSAAKFEKRRVAQDALPDFDTSTTDFDAYPGLKNIQL